MNKDEDVAYLYNLMEKRWALDKNTRYTRPETIDEMRDFILTSIGKEREVKDNVWTPNSFSDRWAGVEEDDPDFVSIKRKK